MAKGVSTEQLFLNSGILSEDNGLLYLNGILIGSGIFQPVGDYALNVNLTQTGIDLILRDVNISGFLQAQINELYPASNPSGYVTGVNTGDFVTRNETGQFASVTSLFNSGVTLTAIIVNSGNSSIIHANGIGSGLSGNLTQTGVLLGAKTDSLSGFTLGASGALQAQIGAGGVTQGQLDSLSGYAEQIFVHRTGAEIISGEKIFNNNVEYSGTLKQGQSNIANGAFSHAEGGNTFAAGIGSHSEGADSIASGNYSHSEGSARAMGLGSHAEGYNDANEGALGPYSHHEGYNNIASGDGSHAEGYLTQALGESSHSEGLQTKAIGNYSHAEGLGTFAFGQYSKTVGYDTVTTASYAFAAGEFNRSGVNGLFQVGRGDGVNGSPTRRDDVIYISKDKNNFSILSGKWVFESGAQVGPNKILTGLVAGTNVTVNNNNDGTFTINSTASGGGGGDVTTAQLNSLSGFVIDTSGALQTKINLNNTANASLATDHTYEGLTIAGLNAGTTIAQFELVYLGASSTWLLAGATGTATCPARGLAVDSYVSTNPAIVLTRGTVRDDTWNWTPGGTLYLSTGAGGITQTAPSATGNKVQQVGFALTADVAYFDLASSEFLEIA